MTEQRACVILSRILKDYIDTSKAESTSLAPNVKEEMCYPDYWISKSENPYTVLMTAEQIKNLNSSILHTSGTNMTDLAALPETFNAVSLAKTLADFVSPGEHYINKTAVSEDFYEQMRQNILNADTSENMRLSYGFAVNYTVMKAYPYAQILTDEP